MTPTEVMRINDLFWTVQGEGGNMGRRSLFVRMPHCNLKCTWCDTQFNSYSVYTDIALTQFAIQEKARFAVITGGEPMMNKDTPKVARILKALGFEIACESNGMFPIAEEIDYATISPKREGLYTIHPNAWLRASEFKYVVDQGFDFKVLERHDDEHRRGRRARLSLSPEWGNFEASLGAILEYQKEHPQWLVSLQTHKFMKIP